MHLIAILLVAGALVAWALAALGAGVDSRPGFGDDDQHRRLRETRTCGTSSTT